MAFSKKSFVTELTFLFSPVDGTLVSIHRQGVTQVLEDGAVVADRQRDRELMTLAQAKTYVAGL